MKVDINTIKNYINGLDECYDFENVDFSKFGEITFSWKERIDVEEHRWYTVDTDVYEVFKDGDSLGHLAIEHVGMLKNEVMTLDDCEEEIVAHNVKEIVKTSYVIADE